MATFFPDIEPDPEKSSAEYRCYKALKGLSDKWVVLHSVYLHAHEKKRSAEADFVLISDRVMLTIEVKGGRVSRRGGRWIYTNKLGQESEKNESPYQQAEGASHAICKLIKKDPEIDKILKKIAVGWGCYLPDVALPDVGATEWPREMICDSIRMDVESLPSAVEAMELYLVRKCSDVSASWGSPPPTPMSKETKSRLVSAIRHDFESMLSISPIAGHADKTLLRMTQGQADVFWGLAEYNARVLVFGPAGTGKTIIANAHFNTLLSSNQDLRVAFVCFNAILSEYLQSLNVSYLNSRRSFVGTAHQFLRDKCPSLSRDKSDLTQCEEEARAWAANNPDKLYDVIVIDEGQDLRPLPQICSALGSILKGGWSGGRWVWFEDLGQTIIRGSHEHFEPPFSCQFPLIHNVRNTKHIAETANALSPKPAKNSDVYGLEVDYRLHVKADPLSRLKELEAAVSDLLKKGFPADQIVLLDYSGGNEALANVKKIAGKYLSPWTLGARSDTLRFSTCRKFKGMESRAVVVYNINGPVSSDDALLYVAVTRPVFSLTLLMDQAARESMARALLRSPRP